MPSGRAHRAPVPSRRGSRRRVRELPLAGLPLRPGPPGCVVAVLVAVAAGLALAGPWLSQLQVQSAASDGRGTPPVPTRGSKKRPGWIPLSDQPYLIAGSIALRRGELRRADAQFAKALGRVPDDAYATLERGAIASTQGRRAEAKSSCPRRRAEPA